MKFLLEKKIAFAYFLAAAAMVLVLVVFYNNTKRVKATNDLVEHTQEVLSKCDDVMMDVLYIETSSRGFRLTGNELFLEPYNTSIVTINGNLATLAQLTGGNANQQPRVDTLKKLIANRLILAKTNIEVRRHNGLKRKSEIVDDQKAEMLTSKIRTLIAAINSNEYSLLKQRKLDNQRSTKYSDLILILFLTLIVIISGLVIYITLNRKIKHEYALELRHSAKLFSNLFNYNPAAIAIYNLNNGEILNANNSFLTLIDYTSKEQVLSKTFAQLGVFVDPKYGELVVELLKENIVVNDLETIILTKKGDIKWVSVSALLLEVETTPCVCFVSIDITDRKKAEEQLFNVNKDLEKSYKSYKLLSFYSRSLIEASLDPLIAINTEGKIVDINQAKAAITGVEREKLIGTNFFDYFTEPQKAQLVYKEVFTNGTISNAPLTFRNVNGKLTDVLFNGSVYNDDAGQVTGAVVVARDITEQKRFEKELIEAKISAEGAAILAEESVRAKQQFLSNMSHEIRTPMNAIIGFTKVMLKTTLNAKQKEYLTAIKMSGDSLIVLINDILDLAKVDSGKMIFEQTPFKMAASITAMLHLFETKIKEKNLQLVKKYDCSIPAVLMGDSARLHQIILNLISNAVKFTSTGQITVSVQMVSENETQAIIEFAVTDTGIGIPPDKTSTVFENFQQAASNISRLYGGTGLGLAIAKQLVESQGGTINVQSKQNEGSTFSFVLTFQKTNIEAEMETEIIDPTSEVKNIKVLVVEDMALNQLLMKTLLDDFGFTHDIAGNGKIAIDKLQHKTYDIVLMDLQMPIMNGFEATAYIRNTMHSAIPIIALTADVTTVDLKKCNAVGMDDYISKPLDERLLYSKIIDLVKKPIIANEDDYKAKIEVIADTGITDEKCTDLTFLALHTRANPQLMMQMITLYLDQTRPLISRMKQGLHDNDWESLSAIVHKLIPSFSIMGIHSDFTDKARKIQEYTNAEQHLDEVPELVMDLENVCTKACMELEIELNLIKYKN